MAEAKATITVPEQDIDYLKSAKKKIEHNEFFKGQGITCEISGNVLSIYGPLSPNHYNAFIHGKLTSKPKGFSSEYRANQQSRQGIDMDVFKEVEHLRTDNQSLQGRVANFDIEKGELEGIIAKLKEEVSGVEAVVQQNYAHENTIKELKKELDSSSGAKEDWYFQRLPEDLSEAVLQSVYKFSLNEDRTNETYGKIEVLVGRLVALGFNVGKEDIGEILKLAKIHTRAPDSAERLERIFRLRSPELANKYSNALVEINRKEAQIRSLEVSGLSSAARTTLQRELETQRAIARAYQEKKNTFTTSVRDSLSQIEELLSNAGTMPVYVTLTEGADQYEVEVYLPVQADNNTKRTEVLTDAAVFGKSHGTVKDFISKRSGVMDLLRYSVELPKEKFDMKYIDSIMSSMRTAARDLYPRALMQLGMGVRFVFSESLQYRLDYKGQLQPLPPAAKSSMAKDESTERDPTKRIVRTDAQVAELKDMVVGFIKQEFEKTGEIVQRAEIVEFLASKKIEISDPNLTRYLGQLAFEDKRLTREGVKSASGYRPKV